MAFYDSVVSLSLVLTLCLHTCSNSLSVPTARILAITLFGMEALWAELELGCAPCSCSYSLLPPLGQPRGGGAQQGE